MLRSVVPTSSIEIGAGVVYIDICTVCSGSRVMKVELATVDIVVNVMSSAYVP